MLSIDPGSIHFWRANLSDLVAEEKNLLDLLSVDELARADRFRFPLDRQRYLLARGVLRKLLSEYVGVLPEEIVFCYGEHGKPFLVENRINLQFNVSHSEDMAVYGVAIGQGIGVDVEKIQGVVSEKVAKRFFDPVEYAEWEGLVGDEKIKKFYEIWTKKEAVIKLLGCGLSGVRQVRMQDYFVVNLGVVEGYGTAVAVRESVIKIQFYDFDCRNRQKAFFLRGVVPI